MPEALLSLRDGKPFCADGTVSVPRWLCLLSPDRTTCKAHTLVRTLQQAASQAL